jgi:hypothetical protein
LLVLHIAIVLHLSASYYARAGHGRGFNLSTSFLGASYLSILSLVQNLISLVYSDGILVNFPGSLLLLLLFTILLMAALVLLNGFVNDFHQILLKSFLLKYKSVFVPDKVWHLRIPAVLSHASFE